MCYNCVTEWAAGFSMYMATLRLFVDFFAEQ